MTTRHPSFTPRRVAVVGGSLGGLFVATLLKQDGHDVTVFERSSRGLARRGAGLVAQQDLYDVLHRLGLDQAADVGVVAAERITLDRSGRVVQRDRTPQTQVSWDHLWVTLRELLDDDEYLLGHRVEEVRSDDTHAEVVCDDGLVRSFDLVVGADGANSVVRQFVAPRDHTNQYVGYSTWRGLVPEGALDDDAAAVLLERFAFYNGPGSHMLGYLVPGPAGDTGFGFRRYNWVWYRPITAEQLARIMRDSGRSATDQSLAPGDLPEFLRDELRADAVAELPTAFAAAVVAEPEPFLQGIVDYVAPALTAHRVVLTGDAAAVVRPHTAMGAAKAAGDALALSDALGRWPLEAALATYDSDRLEVARAVAQYGVRLGRSLPFAARV
ncbi:FAD-dependent monooxygenase [Curtobacterium sp. PhB115]|uniref:FAD binding domain-containing protein n=1 Tax=Curtobacterium sp. PhB115 TaxID=2485173 RepID=UPI000F4C77F3|nr:FAD-dependent monooxygenase [Curtobacterium sp. PhB115]ROP65470.1 2-polyprenyl-6-methoxyphenol hydroxylase-like FAD-dependent oxidoreductase [Curtobacterium sp. PhB115]